MPSTDSPARLSARYSNTARLSGSAQCRSSNTTTTGPEPPTQRHKRSSASPVTGQLLELLDSEADPEPASDSIGCSAARQGAIAGSSGQPRARSDCSPPSVHGRSAPPAASGTALPPKTGTPAAAAHPATSCDNRDF